MHGNQPARLLRRARGCFEGNVSQSEPIGRVGFPLDCRSPLGFEWRSAESWELPVPTWGPPDLRSHGDPKRKRGPRSWTHFWTRNRNQPTVSFTPDWVRHTHQKTPLKFSAGLTGVPCPTQLGVLSGWWVLSRVPPVRHRLGGHPLSLRPGVLPTEAEGEHPPEHTMLCPPLG